MNPDHLQEQEVLFTPEPTSSAALPFLLLKAQVLSVPLSSPYRVLQPVVIPLSFPPPFLCLVEFDLSPPP